MSVKKSSSRLSSSVIEELTTSVIQNSRNLTMDEIIRKRNVIRCAVDQNDTAIGELQTKLIDLKLKTKKLNAMFVGLGIAIERR